MRSHTHARACTPPPPDSRIPEERDATGQAQRARGRRHYWGHRVREELNEKKEEKKKVEEPGERDGQRGWKGDKTDDGGVGNHDTDSLREKCKGS